MPLPWDSKTARVWCLCFRNREERDDPAAFLPPTVAETQALQTQFEDETGLHLRGYRARDDVAQAEPRRDAFVEGMTKPLCYHIDQFSGAPGADPQGDRVRQRDGARHDPGRSRGRSRSARAELASTGRSGRPITCRRSGRSARPSAASSVLSRASCRSPSRVCRPTAATTTSPSGGGEENVFMPDTDDQQRPSEVGLYAIGGIIEHLGPRSTAITRPTVNSYRRLWDTGFWAPVFADWGYQNRRPRCACPRRGDSSTARSTRRSTRTSRSRLSSRAMWDGIDRQDRPGRAEERNIYEAMEAGKQVEAHPDDVRRRARRARGRTRSSRRPYRATCTVCSCTTSGTSGSATAPT